MENEKADSLKIKYEENDHQGKRLIHFVVDYWIMGLASIFVFWFFFGILLAILGIQISPDEKVFQFFINLGAIFLYFFLFETIFGKTVGKMFTGTKVLSEDFKEPTVREIFIRTLIRFIPFEPFSGMSGDFWHDRWSKTMVVSKIKL